MSEISNYGLLLDVWTTIFSRIENIRDIRSLCLICKAFNDKVPVSINTIRCIKSSHHITYDKITKFSNLRDCYVPLSNVTMEQMKTLVKLRTFSVELESSMIFQNSWLSYWKSSEKTQEEFNTISHTFTIAGRSYSGGRVYLKLEFINGVVKSSGREGFALIKDLAAKFYFIIDINNMPPMITAQMFQPHIIGIKSRKWPDSTRGGVYGPKKFNPYKFLAETPNVNYIEAIPPILNDPTTPIEEYQSIIYKRLNSIKQPVNREVSIHIPVPPECLDKIYECFPKLKSIKIITYEDKLPLQKDGVEIIRFHPTTRN